MDCIQSIQKAINYMEEHILLKDKIHLFTVRT